MSAPLKRIRNLSSAELRRAIVGGESDLVEFKRQWPDLTTKEGTARFAKSVLALANTARPDEPGLLLVGVTDDKSAVGVSNQPSAERVSNIVSDYVRPPADVQSRDYELDGVTLSGVLVHWSPTRPHHALRDFPGILERDRVYVRRDKTIGILTIPEIEAMIREKDQRLGPVVGQDPIQFGFVQSNVTGGDKLVARVTNVTTEPVSGVDVQFDVRGLRDPRLVSRQPRLGGATLGPGESREVELRLTDPDFYLVAIDEVTGHRTATLVRDYGRIMGDMWFDVTLHVHYRDRDGFIRHAQQSFVPW
jgi:hypothetical protein